MRPEPARDAGDAAVRVAMCVFAIVSVTLIASFLGGRPVGLAALVHVGVLGVVASVGMASRRIAGAEARALVTAVTVIGSMFFLYASLGQVAFDAIPWDGDAILRAADRAVFLGTEPLVSVSRFVASNRGVTEPFALVYAAFIPYLYVSIFLGLVGRPARVRSVFVLGFGLLYGMAFMGYLFVPARGPIVSMEHVFAEPVPSGFFQALVVQSVESVGGPHGAFPSLHVGASCLAALVDLRHGDTLRGLIYVPVVLLIAIATLVLRYHYFVDIVTGAALAMIAVLLAERWIARNVDEPASSGAVA